jgi:hypothetical protein
MSDQENDKSLDMSPLAEAAVQIHEIYEEFKKAGFSKRESMQLTQNMVATMFSQALKED